jgi:methyl-accepting chemotaxis protein
MHLSYAALLAKPATSSSVRRSRDGAFFAYHGLWAPGVRLFRNLQFGIKALLISAAFVLPTIGLLIWLIANEAAAEMNARKNAVRQHVEIAHGILAWAHGLQAEGMSREEAQARAKQAISKLRYEGNEYFWITDMQARIVMHPVKVDLDGKDGSGIKDPTGFALFKGFVDRVRSDGQGFVSYQWPRPGQEEPVDKISYVKGFEPWGWIVGTGLYVDDLRQERAVAIRKAVLVMASVLAVAGYMFISFYKVVTGGLNETRRHLRAMASGDLTTSPKPWGRDEAADLMGDLAKMQDALRRMVMRVRRSSKQITQFSDEIASGSMNLAARTEQTAANLEESAASTEEISATASSSAEHTAGAAHLARQNAQTAADGGLVMQEVVTTMEGIREASAQIAEIIGAIDSIAFQTNMMGLNRY